MKRLKFILDKITKITVQNEIDQNIESICYDSRKCKAGTMFVALRGAAFDGHNFIPQLIANGISAIVCEEFPDGEFPAVTFVKVQSSRQALAEISHIWFDFPSKKMKFIGITGTNGKTTTTFLISQILEQSGHRTAIVGTTGIYFAGQKIEATHTTPESYELCELFDKMLAQSIEYVIMEVSSHALEQKRVFGIDFQIALFTNLTHDHLDYHKTLENYANVKKLLFSGLSSNSVAIVNGDDPFAELMIKDIAAEKIIKLGRSNENDYCIEDEKITLKGNSFSLDLLGKAKIALSTAMLGKFNIDNSAMAAVACFELGISPEQTSEALANAGGAEGRMTAIKLSNGAIGIIDYSHTPDALEKALKTCREIIISSDNSESKLICVFGCGGDRDKSKRPLMGDIAARFADFTVITDDNPRTELPEDIRRDIIAGIEPSLMEEVTDIAGREKAICFAARISNQDDIVLVAGKGHEKYQITGTGRVHFDDLETLSNCLSLTNLL